MWLRGFYAIGIAGMMLVALGSATFMLLAQHLTASDPSAVGRLLQGFFSGIGFLGGAVIFKGGTDVRGIKTAAAIWTTGAIGLAINTWLSNVPIRERSRPSTNERGRLRICKGISPPERLSS